ncbi:hypothetical protein KR059_004836 [Drosophila kikkawai]|nr:hypothetical protein KR059_004836 [Drosophila kikkawai]
MNEHVLGRPLATSAALSWRILHQDPRGQHMNQIPKAVRGAVGDLLDKKDGSRDFAAVCPFSVREGINIFLDGFVPTENVRFRTEFYFQNHVRHLLHDKIRDAYVHPQLFTDVMKPMKIEKIMDQEVQKVRGFSSVFGQASRCLPH